MMTCDSFESVLFRDMAISSSVCNLRNQLKFLDEKLDKSGKLLFEDLAGVLNIDISKEDEKTFWCIKTLADRMHEQNQAYLMNEFKKNLVTNLNFGCFMAPTDFPEPQKKPDDPERMQLAKGMEELIDIYDRTGFITAEELTRCMNLDVVENPYALYCGDKDRYSQWIRQEISNLAYDILSSESVIEIKEKREQMRVLNNAYCDVFGHDCEDYYKFCL